MSNSTTVEVEVVLLFSLGRCHYFYTKKLGKIPKVGGWVEKKTKNPNFNLIFFKTQGGLEFSKMSES